MVKNMLQFWRYRTLSRGLFFIGAGNDGATGPRKKFDDIFILLDTMHQRDSRTDGHRAIDHAYA